MYTVKLSSMEKEFVKYPLALRLKALGFDEPCFGRYYYKESYPMLNPQSEETELVFEFGQYIRQTEVTLLAPTFSQAFRWFRDNYRMFHEVFIDTEPTVDEPDKLEFTYIVLHMVGMEEMHTSKNKRFKTYEEAELACLDKLIEIVESKSE